MSLEHEQRRLFEKLIAAFGMSTYYRYVLREIMQHIILAQPQTNLIRDVRVHSAVGGCW